MPRVAPAIPLDTDNLAELQRLARAPSTSQALALRVRLVLAAAKGLSNKQIAANFHVSANTVSKWRTRFALYGLSGLTDYEHSGRPTKYLPEVRNRLRQLLRQPPPTGKEHWTVRGLARELGIPKSTVHGLLVRQGVQSRRRPLRRPPQRY